MRTNSTPCREFGSLPGTLNQVKSRELQYYIVHDDEQTSKQFDGSPQKDGESLHCISKFPQKQDIWLFKRRVPLPT